MTVKRILWACMGLILLAVVAIYWLGPAFLEKGMNRVISHQPYPISSQAKELHARLFIGDWHADSLLWDRNLVGLADYGHVDIPRLQQGNVALQMMTTVTKSPAGLNYEENASDAADNITRIALLQRWPIDTWSSLTARALHQADRLYEFVEYGPDDVMLIRTQQEMTQFMNKRAADPDFVGLLLGTEGSHALDGKLENIQVLYDKGFRMMSLQHFFDNKLGGSLHGTSGAGLSEFGQQAVKAMQALNIIVDVSHSSEQTVRDVLAITTKPLVISHTGFKGHCDTKRNIDDNLMQQIAQGDGLIAVGFWAEAVCGTTPTDIAAAIAYGVDLVGEDHISLGSDFDGAVETALDTAEIVAITQALLDIGLEERTIFKVMGGNMLVFLQSQLPSGDVAEDSSDAPLPKTLTQ